MPEYDYSLGKMAGLGEMPGISNIIRRCRINSRAT
jgi:hypothetical protein